MFQRLLWWNWQFCEKILPSRKPNATVIGNLKPLADTNWQQQKETLLMTYKALGRSIANYASPADHTC